MLASVRRRELEQQACRRLGIELSAPETALDAKATKWQCYVGGEAVRQQIIGPGLLGTRSSGPGVG